MRLPLPSRALVALMFCLLGIAAVPSLAAADVVSINTATDAEGFPCLAEPEVQPCTLRSAVKRFNEGDYSGRVVFKIEVPEVLVTHGLLEIEDPAGPSQLVIEGASPGAKITAKHENGIFEVDGGAVNFSHLELAEGELDDLFGSDGGAALRESGGAVTLEDVTLRDNTVEVGRKGGAIEVTHGILLLTNSTIEDSSADRDGGAIYEDTDSGDWVHIEHSKLIENTSGRAGGAIYQDEGALVIKDSMIEKSTSEERGGAIYGDADGQENPLSIEGSKILDSTATGHVEPGEGRVDGEGGAIYNDTGGGLTVVRSLIEGSSAGDGGGGIYAEEATTIRESTIGRNKAGAAAEGHEGGGIYDDSGGLTVEDSTIADNEGSGIFDDAETSSATIVGSTIVSNRAHEEHAGGIYVRSLDEDALELTSTILADNHDATGDLLDCGDYGSTGGGPSITSGGHNLTTSPAVSACGWLASDKTSTDPLLGPLQENGGPTPTMGPTSRTSPAIDGGSHPAATDQRGLTRPVPSGEANTDVGAFEVQAPVSVQAPSISPATDLRPGQTLACDLGTWDTDTITDAAVSYQWFLGSTPESNAATLEVFEGMAGRPITCRVSVDNGPASAEATSAAVELEPAQAVLAPSTLPFGPRDVGSGASAPRAVTLSNEGGVPLHVSRAASSAPLEFPLEGNCVGTIEPGGECTMQVRFDPASPGGKSGTVEVESDGGAPTAALDGTGVEVELGVDPTTIEFGGLTVGSGPTPAWTVTVTNEGIDPIAVGEPQLGGPGAAQFVLDPGTCTGSTATLAAEGGSCEVSVEFLGTAAGDFEASLTVASPSGGEPQVVALSGSATEPPPPPPKPDEPVTPEEPMKPEEPKQPTTSPPAPALASVDVDPGDRLDAGPTGSLTTKLGCTGPAGSTCEVALTVGRVAATPGAPYGFWIGSLAAGTEKRVTIQLSRSAAAMLGDRDKLAAVVLLASGGATVSSTPVTLVAPAPPTLTPRKIEIDGNRLALTVTCAGEGQCDGQVKVTVPGRKAPIAAEDVKVGRGSRVVQLRLSRTALALLEVRAGIKVTVTASAHDATYRRTITRSARLWIRGRPVG